MASPRLPHRASESGRAIPWHELRRHATTAFLLLQAGWAALDKQERERVSELVRKSRGRPRNLTRDEARELGRLAGRAATAARRAAPKRRR
jgi:hypothetical protein